MKILYVATYSGTSGASHSLVNMIVQMKKKGIEPTLIIPNSGPLEKLLKEKNIEYKIIKQFYWVLNKNRKITLNGRIRWAIKQIINNIQELRIYYLIKQKKIDIVHINAITSSNAYLAARISKTPIVWHIREFLEEDLNQKFWDRKMAIKRLNKSSSIITVSNSVKNKYEKILDNNNIVSIYNGIDPTPYFKIENKIFERDTIVLTLVGRLVPQKGHEEVIYALEKIKKEYRNVKVRFIGDKGNGVFLSELEKLVKELKLEEAVDFINYRSDIYNVWAETDIALVASKSEAFGRVTVEAMAAGSLVIGADTGGTSELIQDKYGLLYKQGDSDSLAERISYALQNKTKMQQIAALSRKYALENFTAENNARNIYEVYNKLKI